MRKKSRLTDREVFQERSKPADLGGNRRKLWKRKWYAEMGQPIKSPDIEEI
jgi:hypothetical protein